MSVRRGAVVVWTLMFVVLLVTILCVVLEVAHLYLARVELENALEAAALAGADFWAKNPTDNAGARLVAQAYARANKIDNQPVVLGLNSGTADANLNASPSGNLILGAIGFEPVRIEDDSYLFQHEVEPSCTITETVEANVVFSWKIQTKQSTGTYGDNAVFELEYYAFQAINPPTMPTPRVTKVTFGLAGVGGSELGRFDVDSTPAASESNLGLTDLSGWGPYNDPSAPWQVTFNPILPDGQPNVRYKALEVVPTTPFLPGTNHVIRFGVDTDMMDLPPGATEPVNTKDQGGNNYFATNNFYMAIEFEGDSLHQLMLYGNDIGVNTTSTQTYLNRGQGQKFSFTITRPGNGRYGVRAQANVLVTPWLKSFLGIPIGPFRVAARTSARSGCTAAPRLVRIATDGWTQFPAAVIP